MVLKRSSGSSFDGLKPRRLQNAAASMSTGNTRAEQFWERCGYHEVRRREGIPMGVRVNDVRVMVKPLAEGSIADYLAQVARDRLDSA